MIVWISIWRQAKEILILRAIQSFNCVM
jgi:hypothetical protein